MSHVGLIGLHPAVTAQRPPDSPHGHADTGPPLSGSGRLYLKPVLGGNRPAPVKSLNLNPPSYLPQVRQTPRSIKSTHYQEVGGVAGRIEHRHQPRIEHRKVLAGNHLDGPSAASHALHGGVSPYPGVCSRCIPSGTAHKLTDPAGVAPKQPLKWYGAHV